MSTNDELEAIEWAARGGSSAGKPNGQRGGPRRGSSLFAPIGLGFGGSSNDRVAPAKPAAGDDLLVDFPGSDDERAYDDDEDYDYVSPVLQNGIGPGGGPSFQQVNPSTGIPPHVNPISVAASMPSGMSGMQVGAPMGGVSGGPRRDSVVMQPIAMAALGGLGDYSDSEDDEPSAGGGFGPGPSMPGPALGDPNHRPMVGGFSAAAYEAARAYHYQHQGKARPGVRSKGPQF